MQKLLLVVVVHFLISVAGAQIKEGKVIYERKVDLYRRMTNEADKAMMPNFNIAKVQLLFSGEETIFKNLPEEKDVRDDAGQDGNHIVIHFGGPDNETYHNYQSGKSIELRELGPKKYIIEDSLKHYMWKLEEEVKTISGYVCKKATTKNKDGMNVIAWYAPDLASSGGPEAYGGLPGLILQLDINDAEIQFSALEVSTQSFDKKLVAAPSNGKRISNQEFRKMVEEEMGPSQGGGPTIRIIRN